MPTAALSPITPRAGSRAIRAREPELPAVVHDAVAHQAREGGERVLARRARAEDVTNADPSRDERVRDELSVASPGNRLRAEDRRRSRARDGQEPRQLVAELAAVHVVGVAAEARVPPPDVRGAGPDRTASPEAGEPVIGEARAGERRGEGFPREVRMAT